jgi:hypothetical protein
MSGSRWSPCIYDVLHDNSAHEEKVTELNRYKARIVQFQNDRVKLMLLETDETDKMEAENPTLFYVLRMQKRKTACVIQQIQGEHGRAQSSPSGILQVFATYLRRKYERIDIDEECISAMVEAGSRTTRTPYGELQERPINMEEIQLQLRKVGCYKTPRNVGI